MDIQGLRDKILQLAIQGKLVEQDPNDEPASVLLEKIKEERDKLVREGKIRKPKKLPPIEEDEKPFEIPGSWEWVRLGEVALVNMGQSPKGETVNDNEGMEFHQGKVYFGEIYLNKSDKYTTAPKKIAQPDDILLSVRAPVGTVNITDREVCIGRGLCAISSLGNITKGYYFYTILALEEYLIKKATGTTFLAVTASTVNEMIIPLPPLAEQKRIVKKVYTIMNMLDEIDSNKEDLLKVINLTRNQVLQEAIQGKLVEQNPEDEPASVLLDRIKEERDKLVKEKKIRKPKKLQPIKEEEKPFEIPEGWEWVRLGEISYNIHYGYTAPAKNVDTGVKMLRITDIQDGKVNWENVPYCEIEDSKIQNYKLKYGDILIARTGGTIGKNFLITDLTSTSVFASYLIRIELSIKMLYQYISYFLNSNLYWEQLHIKSKGTGQPNVNAKSLSNLLIPLPPLAEQKRIVEKVDTIMEMLDEIESQLITEI